MSIADAGERNKRKNEVAKKAMVRRINGRSTLRAKLLKGSTLLAFLRHFLMVLTPLQRLSITSLP